jgi:thymidylate synthase (FAD)
MRIVEPSSTFRWVTPDALFQIEDAGRTCYKSEDKMTTESGEKFVRTIVKSGHTGVLEQATASWRFVCDRGISHELVRHRLASYCQESTRYCNYSKDKFGNEITVIEPPGLSEVERWQWETNCLEAETKYFLMLEAGAKPQIARSVLPTCLKTEIVMTCNFTEWRHVFKLRAVNPRAHPQIREIMMPVLAWFHKEYPVIVEDMVSHKMEGDE